MSDTLPSSKNRTILAIEASTPETSIALVRGDSVLSSQTISAARGTSALLFQPLAAALEAGGDQLDLIVIGLGPGSYTGVRIALAAGIALSIARKVPLIGLSSFLGCDAPQTACFVGNARRGSFYYQNSRPSAAEPPTLVVGHEALTAALETSVPWVTVDPLPWAFPDEITSRLQGLVPKAHLLAHSAASLTEDQIQALSQVVPEPIYLAPAFVTTPKRGLPPSQAPFPIT